MNTKQTFNLLVVSTILFVSCSNNCESNLEFGKIEGKVVLAGTLDPAEGVQINLVKTESTGGFPPSTNFTLVAEAFTNSSGSYTFTQDDTGPFSNLEVQCFYNSDLFWRSEHGDLNSIRQTDCGIKEDFVLYPKAKLEVKIGSITLPDNLSRGQIYNGKSDTSIVFSKSNPPSGSILLNVVGNVTDTFYLRFDRWDTIYNAQYPDGYAYDVLDKLVKTPFRVDAWERGKFILNYP